VRESCGIEGENLAEVRDSAGCASTLPSHLNQNSATTKRPADVEASSGPNLFRGISTTTIPRAIQGNFSQERRQRTARGELYVEQNRHAAANILQNQERYSGEGALMIEWAKAVLNGVERERPAWRLVA
jgi:hypothetical protein